MIVKFSLCTQAAAPCVCYRLVARSPPCTLKQRLFYWIPTTILLLFMAGSAVMYFTHSEMAAAAFTQLGYPVYSMYFNAIAKILGGIAIVAPVPRVLKEWEYAGYLYIMLLALQAVSMTMSGIPWTMFVFIAIWAWAYIAFRKRAV